MRDVRVEETYDGVCTLTIGTILIFSGLTRAEADALAALYGPTKA